MSDALTILLFVAVGEGSDATTRAMARATREALGSDASVEIRETASELTDDEALITEQLSHADVVVGLTWRDPGHRSATLHVHVARSGRWLSRSIGFMPSDASTERGRTIGFAVVSMLPEPAEEQHPAQSLPSPIQSEPSRPSPPAVALVRERPVPEAPEAQLPSAPPVVSSFALDLFALGAWGIAGISGGGGGGGGAVAVSWSALAPLSLRLGGGMRAGAMEFAQASTLTVAVSAGVAWHPVRPSLPHRFGVSLRADLVVDYQSLQYVDQHFDHWLPGISAFVEPAWLLAPDLDAVVGFGVEDLFGAINLRNSTGKAVATWPPLRAIGEAGVRVRF